MAPPEIETEESEAGEERGREWFGGLARLRRVLWFWSVRRSGLWALLVLEFVGSRFFYLKYTSTSWLRNL